MGYKIIDIDHYYRKNAYLRFSKGPKCSISMTYKLDITSVIDKCKLKNQKVNIAILYLVSKAVNSRDDYKMYYDFHKDEVRCYETFNPTHYVFDPKTETCKMVHSPFDPSYEKFYIRVADDIEKAKKPGYQEDDNEYPDYFDASSLPWLSYTSFDLELPDGYLYFNPIINWGKFYEDNGKTILPITLRMNHAIADGYLLSKFFLILDDLIKTF
jgi:chloramphenicol O-acetyltransferase type A